MANAHGKDWWEKKIKAELFEIYRYADEERIRQSKLPIVGKTLNLAPLELITIGHLEVIITKYQALFIPSLFPRSDFFTGHMVIIKQVRNALAHVSPAPTVKDIRNARSEIAILLQHISTV